MNRMTKKYLFVLFAAATLLSCSNTGSNKSVIEELIEPEEKKIEGTWLLPPGFNFDRYAISNELGAMDCTINFENDTVTLDTWVYRKKDPRSRVYWGTYVVEGDKILITNPKGKVSTVGFEWKDNNKLVVTDYHQYVSLTDTLTRFTSTDQMGKTGKKNLNYR